MICEPETVDVSEARAHKTYYFPEVSFCHTKNCPLDVVCSLIQESVRTNLLNHTIDDHPILPKIHHIH